jgi:AcrR family transcriptional regulator
MATPKTLERMAELYQNECFGDVFVDAVMLGFTDPAARYILGTIAQFETETKARLRPAMMRFGLSTLPAPQTRENAETMATALRGRAWREVLLASQANIRECVVPRFKEIAAIAAADDDALAIDVADYMVIHETAILELIDRAIAGEANPTRGVEALLHFPLPKPPHAAVAR